jgi:hypothetical protein
MAHATGTAIKNRPAKDAINSKKFAPPGNTPVLSHVK